MESWLRRLCACLCVVFVAGCCLGGCVKQDAQSGGGVSSRSVGQKMSGGYPVGADGKLDPPLDWVKPAEPVQSELSKGLDAAGARAFAEYFISILEYSWNSGDTKRLSEISTVECDGCQNMINNIHKRYEGGGWILDNKYTVKNTKGPYEHPDSKSRFVVVVTYTEYIGRSYRNGKLTEKSEENERKSQIHLCPKNGQDYVCGFTRDSSTGLS